MSNHGNFARPGSLAARFLEARRIAVESQFCGMYPYARAKAREAIALWKRLRVEQREMLVESRMSSRRPPLELLEKLARQDNQGRPAA